VPAGIVVREVCFICELAVLSYLNAGSQDHEAIERDATSAGDARLAS